MADTRAAFVFDGGRCTGCEACRVACGTENAAGGDTGWRRILTSNPARHPALPTLHLSLACNHCDTPACLHACPSAAYRRDEASGAVLLDESRCLGCRYCSWVCPYDAPRFDARRGVMTKCTFCAPRLAAGGEPACTAACPTGALALGQRRDGEREPRGPGIVPTGLGPALRLLPRRQSLAVAGGSLEPPPAEGALVAPPPPRKIALGSEWPLVLFGVLLPALAAWLAAGWKVPALAPAPWLFFLPGAAAIALSALHLGRPQRAWRALANLRRSWLSREIAAAHALLGCGLWHRLAPDGGTAWRLSGALAALAAVALVLSIDGVYRAVPRARASRLPGPHPASVALAAPFLFLVAAGLALPAIALATLRALLLAVAFRQGTWGLGRGWAGLRLVLLAVACAPGLLAAPPASAPHLLALALALAGELLDRAAFVSALEPVSPGRVMAVQAATALARPTTA